MLLLAKVGLLYFTIVIVTQEPGAERELTFTGLDLSRKEISEYLSDAKPLFADSCPSFRRLGVMC